MVAVRVVRVLAPERDLEYLARCRWYRENGSHRRGVNLLVYGLLLFQIRDQEIDFLCRMSVNANDPTGANRSNHRIGR